MMSRRTYSNEARKTQPFMAQVGGDQAGTVTDTKLLEHAAQPAAEAHISIGAHDHQTNANGGKLDHGLSLNGLLDDDHSQYVHNSIARTILAQHTFSPVEAAAPFLLGANAQGQTVIGLKADQLNKSISAGNGLSGGGAMTADRTLSVNQAYNFNWTGVHTFQNDMNAQSILPRATDTYDLGSSVLLWRKGWLSELDAVLFAQNTVTLIGGWFMISKGEGALPADVSAAATTINFGQAMTTGHFVLFRAALKMEYVQIGSLVSGTTYNVTRNLDGSGANDWPAGTPYAILGTNGDGRIELNAYDTPRISVIRQGATYNAQTEDIRLGDLASWQGAGLTGFGAAMGSFSGNEYLYYTPSSGLVVRGTVRADDGFLNNLDISGTLKTGSSPNPRIEITPSLLVGYSDATTKQFWLQSSDGKAYAGNGSVTLDQYGITLLNGTSRENSVEWRTSGGVLAGLIYGNYDSLFNSLYLKTDGPTGSSGHSHIFLTAEGTPGVGNPTSIEMMAVSNGAGTSSTAKLTPWGLDIAGSLGVTGETFLKRLHFKYENWGSFGDGGAAIVNDNGTYKALMLVGNNSAGSGRRHVYVYDDLFLPGGTIRKSIPILCKVRRSSNQTISSGGWSAVVFQQADVEQPADLDMWTSSNGSFMYADPGWYIVVGTTEFGGNANGSRGICFLKNSSEYYGSNLVPAGNSTIRQLTTTAFIYIGLNEYIQMLVYQDSGGDLNITGGGSHEKTSLAIYKLI
jgi:hypothetical protein